jgi:hypothetical protein
MRPSTGSILLGVLAAVLGTLALVAWRVHGLPWASTPFGHGMGVVGTLLMLWAGFGYAWRKRHQALGASSMREAMTIHMVAGLVGPYLVILHSGFEFRWLAGALTVLTMLVVASGVVGRLVFGAVPRAVVVGDPVKAAMLEAEMAQVERRLAELARQPAAATDELASLREAMVTLGHQEELLRSRWRQEGGGVAWRRVMSFWWPLHIPGSIALWVVAAAHVVGTLYYATFSR